MKFKLPMLLYCNTTTNLKVKRRFLIYNKYFMLFLHLRKFKQRFDPYAINTYSFNFTKQQLDQLLFYQEVIDNYAILYLELLNEFIPVLCFLFTLCFNQFKNKESINLIFLQTASNNNFLFGLLKIVLKPLLNLDQKNVKLFLWFFYLIIKVFIVSIKTCFISLYNILNILYNSYVLFYKKQLFFLTHIASPDLIITFVNTFWFYKSLSFFFSHNIYKMILYQKHAINAVTLVISLLSNLNKNQYFMYYNYLSGKLLQKFSLGFFYNKRKKKTRVYGFILRQMYMDMFNFLQQKENISLKFYYLKFSFLRYKRNHLSVVKISRSFLSTLKVIGFSVNFKYPYNQQQFLYYKRKKRRRKIHTLRQIFQKANKNPLIVQRNIKGILNSYENKQFLYNKSLT